ncbi:MAG: peroxiredoxin family protein, partial [Gemmatimonadales bacterium]
HFDGSFVYMISGKLDGDTLRGIFHAGARTQTPWVAVRSTGAPHLPEASSLTRADTSEVFTFSFPDLEGRIVSQDDPRFRGKVLVVDIFGSWCPTCHDAAPVLAGLYRKYHDRGLAMVGLAYEVTGDTAIDNRQVRRFRSKFDVPFPLLLAGINETDLTAATLPQLSGFTSYPTTLFIGRDGRVRKINAGFYGPATGARYERQIREFEEIIERLLKEPPPAS